MKNCNIKQTYFDKDDPWLGILSAAAFEIHSTRNGLKSYSLGQLLFGRDMILLIKNTEDWELISQQNQTIINKDNICKNKNRVDHKYKVGDKIMINNRAAYRYETQYKGLFMITWCWNNGTVIIKYGPIQIRHNISQINPYKSDTKVEDINPKNMCDNVNI